MNVTKQIKIAKAARRNLKAAIAPLKKEWTRLDRRSMRLALDSAEDERVARQLERIEIALDYLEQI